MKSQKKSLYVAVFSGLVSLGTGYGAYYSFKSGNNLLLISNLGFSIANLGFAYQNFQHYRVGRILDNLEKTIEEGKKTMSNAITTVDNAIHTLESELVKNQIKALGNTGLEDIE
ncbi:hypothetical protein HYT56_02930 [Candidatus Woesearchaeota archaeon]|nr:hypothetical protein [Candidatus Woesearchaeota archaeon]